MPQLSRCTCNIKFNFSNQKTNGILCCCHRFLSSRGYSITLTVLILLSVFTPIFPFSPRPTKKSVASQSRELSQLTAFQTRRPYKQNLLSLLNDKPYSYHFSLASASSASDTQQDGTIDSKATSATTKINAQAEQLEQIKHKTGKDYPQRKNYNNNYNNSNNRYSNKCSVRQNKKRKVRHLYSKARDLERRGLWKESCEILEYIVLKLEPKDAHSYLALARLQSRRERGQFRQLKQMVMNTSGAGEKADIDSPGDHAAIVASGDSKGQNSNHGQYEQGESRARKIFRTGTHYCPDSIHLWHGWAMHEQSLGNLDEARRLLDNALKLDPSNGYVCHAYGMMEMQSGNLERARVLWQQGIKSQPSAALVCSLGQLYTSFGDAKSARDLYSTNVSFLPTEREQIEVYLAAASLEETAFNDVGKASELLKAAINDGRTEDSRPYVALARLGSQVGLVDDRKVKQRLREICTKQVQRVRDGDIAFPVKDGRLFNAWAKLESKSGRLAKAKDILRLGIELYPKDHTLLQAAGNIEERQGNFSSARDFYSASLLIEPSAPTLIAYAMLELRNPLDNNSANITMVRRLFQEALLIDPKHGPAYNAFGNLERRQGNVEEAKQLYADGINVNCTDSSSVYHGLGKLHLSLGEVEEARNVLQKGLDFFETNEISHNQRNENVAFLAHTLAMIELNVNHNSKRAKSILQQGLSHCRNSSPLLMGVAQCESRLGNEQRARDMFQKSLAADPEHTQAWQAFGVMEMKAGNYRSAKMLFECGLKNSPTHGALWQAYGTLESRKGNVGVARLLFAAGIEKCPKHVPLYQAWACLELRDGDVITAKRLIGEALTRDKRNGSGWLVAAKIEEKMDNHGLVGLILRRGIECSPNDTELYRALAEYEISRGQIDRARELLERGLDINPFHADLYHSLAELEARVFNIEGLAKLNKRAMELFQSDAMAPPTASSKNMQAWSKKIKHGRWTRIPNGITALADKIGVESDADVTIAGFSLEDVDLDAVVDSICGFGNDDNALLV